jgi:hypothetical protein
VGVDKDVLRSEFRRLGLPLSPHGDLKCYADEVILEAHAVYINGDLGLPDVAERYGIHASTLRRSFQRLGLSFKDGSISKKRKTRATCLRRYGVDSVLQCKEVRKKISQSRNEAAISAKRKRCVKERYGVGNISQVAEVKAKKIARSMEHFGTEYVLQAPAVIDASRRTRLERRLSVLLPLLDTLGYTLLDEYRGNIVRHKGKYEKYIRYRMLHAKCGREFVDDVMETPRCPYCYGSRCEGDYLRFVEGLGFEVKARVRSIIKNPRTGKGLELDIVIPSKKIAFEYNGVFWHGGIKHYHQMKTRLCAEAGWSLYHIWEHQPQEMVQSRILNVLGMQHSVGARTTVVEEIDTSEAAKFFLTNHLHGDAACSYAWGLRRDGELLAALGMRKHPEGWEVARFCSRRDLRVVGGFTRLLKASSIRCTGTLISFADRDWSPLAENTVYYRSGFTCDGDSGPMLSYYHLREQRCIARQSLQKHKLKELFPDVYDSRLTAQQILSKKGIVALWNSGNWKFHRQIS